MMAPTPSEITSTAVSAFLRPRASSPPSAIRTSSDFRRNNDMRFCIPDQQDLSASKRHGGNNACLQMLKESRCHSEVALLVQMDGIKKKLFSPCRSDGLCGVEIRNVMLPGEFGRPIHKALGEAIRTPFGGAL